MVATGQIIKKKGLKTHRTIGGCPNFKKKSSTVFGRDNNIKTNITDTLTSENISVSNFATQNNGNQAS